MEIIITHPSLPIYGRKCSFEQLRQSFFKPDKGYWELAGEQPTHVLRTGDNQLSELVFWTAPNAGVLIEHAGSASSQADSVFLSSEIDDKETVEAFGENRLVKYYRKYFLPVAVAWQAIEHFAQTGEPHPGFDWRELKMPAQDSIQTPAIDKNPKFVFADPMNIEHEYFDRRWLQRLVLERGDDYWTVMNGESLIYLINFDDAAAHLRLLCNEKHGFVIEYNRKDEQSLNAVRDRSSDEIVEVDCYGDATLYYGKYLTPKETAWKIIEYFFDNGEKYPYLIWETVQMPETA